MSKAAILKDALYIPEKYLEDKEQLLEQEFHKRLYNDRACENCELLDQRHALECETCVNFTADLLLWKRCRIGNDYYIKLPPANRKETRALLDLPSIPLIDKRKDTPFTHNIKFTGDLYGGEIKRGQKTVDQKSVVKDFLKAGGNGIICCPPRSGKTVIASYITCQLGVKTLILADQNEFLQQFYATFVGDDASDRGAMTNIANMPDKKQVIRLIDSPRDLEGIKNVDIILCNYRKFILSSKSLKRLTKTLGHVGFVIIDEVDAAGARGFYSVLSKLKCKYKLGLSATWERKDGRSWLLKKTIGKVTSDIEGVGFKPSIVVTEPKVSLPYPYKTWVGAMKGLASSKERNKFIVKLIKKDWKDGHSGIIIPVDFLNHAKVLKDAVNARYGAGTAEIFSSKTSNRKMLLNDFDNGKVKVLIAIRRMMKRGVDLKNPTMVYIVVPMSAVDRTGAPMFYQLAYRVATACAGKRQPCARIFVDDMEISKKCFVSLFWKEIFPNSKGTAKYTLDEKNRTLGISLASAKSAKVRQELRTYAL
jgi:superfamily II DNA or RNA helicase